MGLGFFWFGGRGEDLRLERHGLNAVGSRPCSPGRREKWGEPWLPSFLQTCTRTNGPMVCTEYTWLKLSTWGTSTFKADYILTNTQDPLLYETVLLITFALILVRILTNLLYCQATKITLIAFLRSDFRVTPIKIKILPQKSSLTRAVIV